MMIIETIGQMFKVATVLIGLIVVGYVALLLFDGMIGARLLAARKARRNGET